MKRYLLLLLFAAQAAFAQAPQNTVLPSLDCEQQAGVACRVNQGTWLYNSTLKTVVYVNGVQKYTSLDFVQRPGETYRVDIGATKTGYKQIIVSSKLYGPVPNYVGEVPYPAPPTLLPLSTGLTYGVNLSGGENKSASYYPKWPTLEYFHQRGFNTVRVPYSIARLQPVAYGPLVKWETDLLNTVIDEAAKRGMYVIMDPHDYAVVRGKSVSLPGVASELSDFSYRSAVLFKNKPNVKWNLMNEPAGIDAKVWQAAAHKSIVSIRAAGATQQIIIPVVFASGAAHFTKAGNDVAWDKYKGDPLNNFIFDIHAYLDQDAAGNSSECVKDGWTRFDFVTPFLVRNGFKAVVGEFAFDPNNAAQRDNCLKVELPLYMAYLKARPKQWTGWVYWLAGERISDSDPFKIQPAFTAQNSMVISGEAAQVPILQSYMGVK